MSVVTYHVYCRVVFNTLALLLHAGNGIYMFFAMQGDVLKDPQIQTLKEIQFKYITIWNLVCQVIFLAMSLICDIPLIFKIFEDSTYLDHLRSYKKVFFSGIVWPLTVTIFLIFWPIFIYDRELVFPAFIDKAISPVSNHIMHSVILLIALWEILFQPRSKPASHKWYLGHFFVIYIIYLIVLFTNYAQRGIWPYPVLKVLYGTPYFPVVFVTLPLIGLCMYYLQWLLTTLRFETCVKNEKIR